MPKIGRRPLPAWRLRRVLHTTVAPETFQLVVGNSGGSKPWRGRGDVLDDALRLLGALLETCPDKTPRGIERRLQEVEDLIRGDASPVEAINAR